MQSHVPSLCYANYASLNTVAPLKYPYQHGCATALLAHNLQVVCNKTRVFSALSFLLIPAFL